MLTSKAQELQSIIAALRTEISEAQDINRSLQKSNQELLKENEDLRLHRESESQKETAVLKNEISRLRLKVDDLNKQVDYSNADAVRKAYDELERARKELGRYKAYAAKKLHGVRKERDRSVAALSHRIKALSGSLWLCRDLLLLFAYFTMTAEPVILLDIWELLTDAFLSLESYCDWIIYPCYAPYPGAMPVPYEPGTAWAVRTASVIAGLVLVILLSYIGRRVYNSIRAQWCKLATRVSLSLLIIVSVLGSVIKEYLRWNTAVLLFFLFLLEMRFLLRFENMFTKNHKTDQWERIKDQNDRSYFVTFHIYTCFHEMIWNRNKTNI